MKLSYVLIGLGIFAIVLRPDLIPISLALAIIAFGVVFGLFRDHLMK